jgi:hypothetical protein
MLASRANVGAEVARVKQKASSRRGAAKRPAKATSRRAKTAKAATAAARKVKASSGRKTAAGRKRPALKSPRAKPKATLPARGVTIKALDPFVKCGPGTSVTELYRVDEAIDGRTTVHLVFFDRHGWYCEHGRSCRAVEDVRRRTEANGRGR